MKVQAYTKNGTPIPIENFVKTSDALGTGTDREVIIGDGTQGNVYKGSGVIINGGGVISNVIVPLSTIQYSGSDALNFMTGTPVTGEWQSVANPSLANLQHTHSNAANGGTLPASSIASGQLALARGGTGADLSATGGANQIVRQNSSGGAFTVSVLAAGDIPNLDASKITTGTLAFARGGSQSVTLFNAAPTSGAYDFDLTTGDAPNCTHLEGVGYLKGTVSATTDIPYIFFNADTTVTNYRHAGNASSEAATNTPFGGNTPRMGNMTASTAPADDFAIVHFWVENFRDTNIRKMLTYTVSLHFNTGANTQHYTGAVYWNATSAITALKIRTDNHSTDTLNSGCLIHLRGIKA